jgi:hypothetical protein
MPGPSPLLALFGTGVATKKPKTARKDPVKKRAKTGEKSLKETGQQHGELPTYVEPTPAQRMRDNAKEAKIRATDSWVHGHINTAEHNKIHVRANRVLTNKGPKVKLPAKW